MLISCEKCSTTYVLDDALIPPQGAPVQCTRCGHVFTARLAPAEPAPIPPPPRAPGSSTMMFGAPPPAPPPPNARSTMVFGAAPPAPNPRSTMMFGTSASNAAPAPPPPGSSKTMVFGTAAPNAAASQPHAPAPAVSAKQTMVFGAAAPPPAAKNTTMMFGTPASNAIADSSEETVLEQPSQSSRTVLFGALPPVVEPASAAPAKNQTMMFGRPAAIPKISPGVVELAGMSVDEGAPNESTVRVDVAQGLEQRGEAEDPQPELPRHDRTQRFAMSAGAAQERRDRTQLFSNARTLPIAAPGVLDEGPSSVFVGDATLPPDAMQLDPPGVSLLHDPAQRPPPEAMREDEGPVATTLPHLPVLQQRMAPLALELPPEPMGSPQDLRVNHSQQLQQQANEDAAALRAVREGGGAGRAIVVILIIVALGLTGVLIYRLFGRQLMQLLGVAAPVEAIHATDQALAILRLDDRASQERAVAQLTAVLARHPELPETQAGLVIATAVRFDDVQGELTRAEALLRALKTNGGAAARVAELGSKVSAGQASAKALRAELEAGLERLSKLTPKVEAGSSTYLAMLRAEGMGRGVLGDAEALTRAVAFKQRTETRDDWVEMIEPEYALNGGTSLDEAIDQLVALKARGSNSTFLRPYVLLARLQLKKGEPQRARDELEQVTTMNQRHEIARELLASIAAP